MTTPAYNVQIYWGDGAGENYQFVKNPHISLTFPDARFSQLLGNTLSADYWLGVKASIILSWMPPRMFEGDQYEQLITMYNQFDTICVYPEPELLPSLSFLCRIVNKFDFDYVEGATKYAYFGKMVLEGAEVLSSIPSGVVLLCP